MKKTIEIMAFNEKIINDGLRGALRERDATRAIELFLEHICQKSNSGRIYIFEGEKGCNVNNTFEWCAPGVSSEKDNLQNVPFEAVEWWYKTFEEKSSIIIENIEAIKELEPLTYKYLKPQNIHSLIASPLILEDKIIGFYGVDNPPAEIMPHITNAAEIVGHFIVSLLEKQRLMKELEKLSFEDSLSGVYNRHALNTYNFGIKLNNVGIVYCDVLGLKKINDSMGHQAGDELILRASQCLKDIFNLRDIYRVGGDEFLVLSKNIDEKEFVDKVNELRVKMDDYNAKMSIGSLWQENVDDLDEFIARADKLMYHEKREYYLTHNR